MRLRWWKRCKHEHVHEEAGEWVEVRDAKSRYITGTNVCLMDMFVVCDDCGHRDQAPSRIGYSSKPPGRYAAR